MSYDRAEKLRCVFAFLDVAGWMGNNFWAGLLHIVQQQPFFQELDSFMEAVSDVQKQIDVVDIFPAVEAMGEIVPGVDRRQELTAVVTDETETAFGVFRTGSNVSQLLDDV